MFDSFLYCPLECKLYKSKDKDDFCIVYDCIPNTKHNVWNIEAIDKYL